MSVAEPLPAAGMKNNENQKWHTLFPERWAELAFDSEWRKSRIEDLLSKQKHRFLAFGVIAFTCLFVIVTFAIRVLASPKGESDLTFPVWICLGMTFSLVTSAVVCLKTEVERIILQVIDRLSSLS
jgi:hypothetical protein